MTWKVNDDGLLIEEEVGLSYEQNYIQINTPALEGSTPAIIICDSKAVKINIISIVFCTCSLHIL